MQFLQNLSKNGLTEQQAQQSIELFGANELADKQKKRPLSVFIGQFKDVMTMILLAATVLSVIMGSAAESIAILVIVLVNALLGFFQEYRTEKALEKLKDMAAPTTRVIRNGREQTVASTALAIGDLVLLRAGDRVPADGVLFESVSLQSDESLLTGESLAVDKSAAPFEKAVHWLSEQASPNEWHVAAERVHMGCVVTRGRGQMLVTSVGMHTRMGQVAGMLRDIKEEPTPLQKQLAELGKYIAIGCLAICAVVALTGWLRGENLLDMLLTGISLAVAAVPEGLPAIVTISLALAVGRIYKRNALIKKLHAVETLGCAGVICSDKTGTLTENRMTVQVFYAGGRQFAVESNGLKANGQAARLTESPEAVRAAEIAVLCNSGRLRRDRGGFTATGDATEAALLVAGARCGMFREQLEKQYTVEKEIPFDSDRKRMSVVVRDRSGKRMLFVKGASDLLLERCASVAERGGTVPLTPSRKEALRKINAQMAAQALRVIGVACRPLGDKEAPDESRLVFCGYFGMLDPPRKEAAEAVRRCRRAGIRPVMITGDHLETAKAIAAQVGIYKPGQPAYTGAQLDRMDDKEFAKAAVTAPVFARVSPGHKLRLVRALKKQGQIVAMTGDGVNDAPAVKEADIGVSMGRNGTDVTKEAAGIILLDDNFATLVAAVEEGRTIYANIRKFIRYLLSCNIGEVLTMFVGMLCGLPVVLLPIQILLINLMTDGLPAIALGLDPTDPQAMNRPPRGAGESIFAGGLAGLIIFRGILICTVTLTVFITLLNSAGLEVARTGAFLALVIAQLIHVFECKSETKSLLRIPIFNNVRLILAVLSSAAIIFAAIYIPALQPIFSTVALTGRQLLMVFGICLSGPVVATIALLPVRRRQRRLEQKWQMQRDMA